VAPSFFPSLRSTSIEYRHAWVRNFSTEYFLAGRSHEISKNLHFCP
jgi:hypothetical protein